MEIKTEFYDYANMGGDRVDFNRPFPSPGLLGLAVAMQPPPAVQYGLPPPFAEQVPSSSGKAMPIRKSRKLSMNDARPRPIQTGPRTMSFSMPSSHGHPWETMPSLVPSFGSAAEDAFFDSPITPALEVDEQHKKQRRRECHNQVEKRRREHINLKIEELSQLLPPSYNIPDLEEEDEQQPVDSPKKKKRSGSTNKKDTMQCKGQVLSQSVQYIHDLKHLTEMQAVRIHQLESMMSNFQMPTQIWNHVEPPQQTSPDPELQTVWPVFEPSPFSSGSQSSPDQRNVQPRPVRKESEIELQMGMGSMDLDNVLEQRWQ